MTWAEVKDLEALTQHSGQMLMVAGQGLLSTRQVSQPYHSLSKLLNLEILSQFPRLFWFPLRTPIPKTALMVNLRWETNWTGNDPMIPITREAVVFNYSTNFQSVILKKNRGRGVRKKKKTSKVFFKAGPENDLGICEYCVMETKQELGQPWWINSLE